MDKKTIVRVRVRLGGEEMIVRKEAVPKLQAEWEHLLQVALKEGYPPEEAQEVCSFEVIEELSYTTDDK